MNGDPAHLRLVWTKVIVRLDHSLKKNLFSGSISFSIILIRGLHSVKHVPYIHLLGGFFLGVLVIYLARENTKVQSDFCVLDFYWSVSDVCFVFVKIGSL